MTDTFGDTTGDIGDTFGDTTGGTFGDTTDGTFGAISKSLTNSFDDEVVELLRLVFRQRFRFKGRQSVQL
jgi:hypothetical protein